MSFSFKKSEDNTLKLTLKDTSGEPLSILSSNFRVAIDVELEDGNTQSFNSKQFLASDHSSEEGELVIPISSTFLSPVPTGSHTLRVLSDINRDNSFGTIIQEKLTVS